LDFRYKPKSDLLPGPYPWTGILAVFFGKSPVIWEDLGYTLFGKLFGCVGDEPPSDRDVLISDENAGSWVDPFVLKSHLITFQRLTRKWNFGRVRVLISVRNQAEKFASSYAQISDRRVGASQADFEQRVDSLIGTRSAYYRTGSGSAFDYEQLLRALRDAVGAQNVLLLPYELMRNDMEAFLSEWFAFLGLPNEGKSVIQAVKSVSGSKQNVRSTSDNTWRIRERTERDVPFIWLRPGRVFSALGLPNKLLLRWPDFKRESEIRLTEELRNKIMDRYRESNRALERAIGMDLSQYGYY